MYGHDVELALLSSRPSEVSSDPASLNTAHVPPLHHETSQAQQENEDPRSSRINPKALEEGGGINMDFQGPLENGDVIQLPRKKVEQLMGLWIDMLQKRLSPSNEGPYIREKPIERFYDSARQPTASLSTSRYPPISYPVNAHPWRNSEPMAQFELEAEDRWRSLGRSMWKTPENLAHLEDSWKHLWEPMVGIDRGLFQWPISKEIRVKLQDELIDALNANERIVAANMYMRRDFRTISTFISMIGLRLNDQYRSYHRHQDIWPIKQLKILVECIWACNAFDPSNDVKTGYREGPRLSNVLTACYRRQILNAPEEFFNDHITRNLIQRHCQDVRRALHLINLLQNNHISEYIQCENLTQAQQLWSTPLPDIEAPPRILHRTSTLRDGVDAFLRIGDFNLKDLQMLGHLQIQWTSYWDEHLQLETSSTANILKVYWFQPKLARYLVENHLCSQISSNELTQREDELFRTWCLIFTSKSSERQSRARYKSLRAPRWLSLLGHTKLNTWTPEQATNNSPDSGPLISRFTTNSSLSNYCYEMHDHLLLQWSKDGKLPHERISYSQFPIYADRLRELRIYMDSQQPTGLRALWKDRRNSNTYYTFWFVTIFGSLSVFLATCALAVGIAQTWAAFRQLDG